MRRVKITFVVSFLIIGIVIALLVFSMGWHTSARLEAPSLTKDVKTVYFRGQALEGADPQTFMIINKYYEKDRGHVYFGAIAMKTANPETFAVLNGKYANDGSNYNYLGGAIVSELDDPNWDVGTYEVLSSSSASYARDSNHYYYNGVPLDKMPTSSLVVLSDDYAKDAQRAYYQFNVIAGADPSSFVAVQGPGFDAEDGTHHYLLGRMVQ
jgi:hypothetical protein